MGRMPTQRDVWRIDRAGSLDRLTRRTETLPDPGPGEARITIRAVGLNFADVFACLGLYSATPKGAFVPGLEFSGIVDAVGPSSADEAVPPIGKGDVVVGVTRFGGYATAANVDWRYLRPLRTGWSFAEGAAFPVQALTAWYGLVQLGGVEAGDVVLLHSAAGGVGLNALAILGAVGARPIATVGGHAKRDWLVADRGLSPAQVIVRDPRTFGADLDRALAAMDASGFDLVFDAVAGPFFRPALDRVRPEGRVVIYGAADFMSRGARVNYPKLAWRYLRRPRVDPLSLINENRSVMGFNLIWLWDRVDRLAEPFRALDRFIATPPLVGRRFGFGEAPAAMRFLQSGESVGKVVLDVD
jgi:NADPH:quinone reductase-like Zn-dependent oxidoreductase